LARIEAQAFEADLDGAARPHLDVPLALDRRRVRRRVQRRLQAAAPRRHHAAAHCANASTWTLVTGFFLKMVSEAQRTGLGRQLETGGVDAGIRAEDDAQLVSMAK